MITFKEYLSEKAEIMLFGPKLFDNKKQMNAIAKSEPFKRYIAAPLKKAYGRRDHNPVFDISYWITNEDQKYVVRFDVSKGGKIYGWTVYTKNGKELNILKQWGEQ